MLYNQPHLLAVYSTGFPSNPMKLKVHLLKQLKLICMLSLLWYLLVVVLMIR